MMDWDWNWDWTRIQLGSAGLSTVGRLKWWAAISGQSARRNGSQLRLFCSGKPPPLTHIGVAASRRAAAACWLALFATQRLDLMAAVAQQRPARIVCAAEEAL